MTTSWSSEDAQEPERNFNTSFPPVVAGAAAQWRFSQRVFCNILSLCEASLVGVLVILTLPRMGTADLARNSSLTLAAGPGIALLVASLAGWSGAASYHRFASRLALLPGAACSALLIGWIAFLGNASRGGIILEMAAVFASVYVVKIPMVGIVGGLTRSGFLTRFVAVIDDDNARRAELSVVMTERDDIKIVYSGKFSTGFGFIFDLAKEGLLDEIACTSSTSESEMLALTGLAATVVRLDYSDLSLTSALRSQSRSPWNMPYTIIARPPLRDWAIVVKRIMDIVGSALAILLLLPIIAICMIAIWVETPGNVFFVQERAGYRNRPFRMIKFRSMYPHMTDHTGSQLTQRSDPRVTKVGRILRRTSADELPQFFNVLCGRMSLVGPRPHPAGAKAGDTLYDDLIPNFYARYRIKPGITGSAQISGLRGNTETEQHLISRFDSDMRYISEWTPMLDISILARTVFHIFEGTNAF